MQKISQLSSPQTAPRKVAVAQELAGEPVILVHRLMKNGVPLREYVLLSDEAARHAGLRQGVCRTHRETLEGMGERDLVLVSPADLAGP